MKESETIWKFRKRAGIHPSSVRETPDGGAGLLNELFLNSHQELVKPSSPADTKILNIRDSSTLSISILNTQLMHWLFIHKILFSSTYFEPQVLIFRGIELYTCRIWYCHSLWEFLVACRYTAWVRTGCRGKVYSQCTVQQTM